MQRSERRFRMLCEGIVGRNLKDEPFSPADSGYINGQKGSEKMQGSERRFRMLLERLIELARRVEEFVSKI